MLASAWLSAPPFAHRIASRWRNRCSWRHRDCHKRTLDAANRPPLSKIAQTKQISVYIAKAWFGTITQRVLSISRVSAPWVHLDGFSRRRPPYRAKKGNRGRLGTFDLNRTSFAAQVSAEVSVTRELAKETAETGRSPIGPCLLQPTRRNQQALPE